MKFSLIFVGFESLNFLEVEKSLWHEKNSLGSIGWRKKSKSGELSYESTSLLGKGCLTSFHVAPSSVTLMNLGQVDVNPAFTLNCVLFLC